MASSSISSAAKSGDNMAALIVRGIESAITEKSHEIVKRHQEQIAKELEDVRSEVVANAALRIAKHSTVQYAHDRLVIEIMDNRVQL